MDSDKPHVALVKRACRICGEAKDAEILLAKRYLHGVPVGHQQLKEANGQVIGFFEEACDECKKTYNMEEYYVVMGIIPSKSDDINNPFRNGEIIQIKKESALGKDLNEKKQFKNGMAYAEPEFIEQMKKIATPIN